MIQITVSVRKLAVSQVGIMFSRIAEPLPIGSNESATAIDETIVGPVLSLDLGSKRVGAAISDPTLVAITALETLDRSSWKRLLHDVRNLIRHFDAKTLVIGLPLQMDGTDGRAAGIVRQAAQKFARSLDVPIYLQDERLTSVEAEAKLRSAGYKPREIALRIDGESAAIILRDFIVHGQQRMPVVRPLN